MDNNTDPKLSKINNGFKLEAKNDISEYQNQAFEYENFEASERFRESDSNENFFETNSQLSEEVLVKYEHDKAFIKYFVYMFYNKNVKFQPDYNEMYSSKQIY